MANEIFLMKGSKEETFFDSQAWLDSDCDDDFLSVAGGTSSRGHTPGDQNFRSGNPLPNKTFTEDKTPGSVPEPSPTGKKMKLSELFQQSIREAPEDKQTSGSQNTADEKVEVKKTILDVLPVGNGTPYISGTNSVASSERTTNGDSEKPMRSVQCCLPSLVSRNFSERKKKMSPAIAING